MICYSGFIYSVASKPLGTYITASDAPYRIRVAAVPSHENKSGARSSPRMKRWNISVTFLAGFRDGWGLGRGEFLGLGSSWSTLNRNLVSLSGPSRGCNPIHFGRMIVLASASLPFSLS